MNPPVWQPGLAFWPGVLYFCEPMPTSLLPYYQQAFPIEAGQVAPAGWLHLHEANRLLQTVAGAHADSWGLGFEGMAAQGLVWVLSRLHLRWQALPRWRETLTLGTWVHSMSGPVSARYFQLHGSGGSGVAATRWVALDRRTGRPARTQFTQIPLDPRAVDPHLSLESLPAVTGLAEVAPFVARFTDLDPVGHVNNAAYLRWVVDSYEPAFVRNHHPVEVRIHYLAEVRGAEQVMVCTGPADTPLAFHHELRRGEAPVCRLYLRWQPDNP